MDLKVNYQVAKNKLEAFDLARAQITPEYVAKFNVPCDIEYKPDSGLISAKGKGFTLNLQFDDSSCQVSLDLSFLLKPLKGKILETIENKIKKTV